MTKTKQCTVQISKCYTYWPDGSWKETPSDGFVYALGQDTYQWDGFLDAWVSSYGGKIIDFSPKGMPIKTYELSEVKTEKQNSASCECGAHKTSNPNCHAHWCPKTVEAL